MTAGTPLPLDSLPPEIILLISEHMDAYDLIHLSRTCRSLNHLSGCKSVAKAFTRRKRADRVIEYLRDAKVSRMDLVVELFRLTTFDRFAYTDVVTIAARLNDISQLEAWHDDFGFIPPDALIGAAQSDQVQTFEFLISRVVMDDGLGFQFFVTIGTNRNRALLNHLRTKYPDLVTLEDLVWVLRGVSVSGDAGMDFAQEIFDSLPPHPGNLFAPFALEIVNGAAASGNQPIFSKFIDMFQYDYKDRVGIAESAAIKNHVDILRLQYESQNQASSLHTAILGAVENNAHEALEYLLEIGAGDWKRSWFWWDDSAHPFMIAIRNERTTAARLMMAYVPAVGLLRGAKASKSFAEAVMLLREYQRREGNQIDGSSDSSEYSNDVIDWKAMISLVVMCLDDNAFAFHLDIYDDDERALYRDVFPTAINLARELGMSDYQIALMILFVDG